MPTPVRPNIVPLCLAVIAVASSLSSSASSAAEALPQPARFAKDGKLRVIVFGAHPDDAELSSGGVAALWAAAGHHVKLVAMTNGDIGHWQMSGGALAQRRGAEVRAASKVLGTTVEVLDIHDGELLPTLEVRKMVVRLIRSWGADIVISHRPNDYHPDHRNTGLVVRDAGYMVMVPYFCPDTPYLDKNPVFLHSEDHFRDPPFRADVVVPIDGSVEKKAEALSLMESQFSEGGCCAADKKHPADRKAARDAAKKRFRSRAQEVAERHRGRLVELLGQSRAAQVKHAEAFELGEYGRTPSIDELKTLFPF